MDFHKVCPPRANYQNWTNFSQKSCKYAKFIICTSLLKWFISRKDVNYINNQIITQNNYFAFKTYFFNEKEGKPCTIYVIILNV